jgi:hypothetical protein
VQKHTGTVKHCDSFTWHNTGGGENIREKVIFLKSLASTIVAGPTVAVKRAGGFANDYGGGGGSAETDGADYAEDYAEDKDFSEAKKGKKQHNSETNKINVFIFLRKYSKYIIILVRIKVTFMSKIKFYWHKVTNN